MNDAKQLNTKESYLLSLVQNIDVLLCDLDPSIYFVMDMGPAAVRGIVRRLLQHP